MADAQLAQDIRQVLNNHAMTNVLINTLIVGPLKEVDIASNYGNAVTNLNNHKAAFAQDLHNALIARGATLTGPVYNLNALGLRMGTKLAATEELSAIHTHAPTPGFDAAKALTNMLRLIKAAERP